MIMCKCTNGILYPQNRENLPDGDVWIKILGDKRTDRQNRYFWVLMNILADWQGEENVEEFKEDLMKHIGHIKTRIDSFTGEEITEGARTKDLSITDFNSLLERIKLFAEKNGVIIPDKSNYNL